jgi:hypothetical protein
MNAAVAIFAVLRSQWLYDVAITTSAELWHALKWRCCNHFTTFRNQRFALFCEILFGFLGKKSTL